MKGRKELAYRAGANILRAVRAVSRVESPGRLVEIELHPYSKKHVAEKVAMGVEISPADFAGDDIVLAASLHMLRNHIADMAAVVNDGLGDEIYDANSLGADLYGIITDDIQSAQQFEYPLTSIRVGNERKTRRIASLFAEGKFNDAAEAIVDLLKGSNYTKPNKSQCAGHAQHTGSLKSLAPQGDVDVEMDNPRKEVVMDIYNRIYRVLKHTYAERSVRTRKRYGKRLVKSVLFGNTPKYPFTDRDEVLLERPKVLVYLDMSGTMSFSARSQDYGKLIHAEYMYALILTMMDIYDVDVVMHNGRGVHFTNSKKELIDSIGKSHICCGEGKVPLVTGDYDAVVMLTDMGWRPGAFKAYFEIVNYHFDGRRQVAVHGLAPFISDERIAEYVSDDKLAVVGNVKDVVSSATHFDKVLRTMINGAH